MAIFEKKIPLSTIEDNSIEDKEFDRLLERLKPQILQHVFEQKPWTKNLFVPPTDIFHADPNEPFMPFSTCSAADYFHPEFHRITRILGLPSVITRKYWEWIFIFHHAFRTGSIAPGKRGLAFGVGQEPLPAAFAMEGAFITATDAPESIGVANGWNLSNEYSNAFALLPNGSMDRSEFERMVEWRVCDMNAIDPELTGYDICWSSCAFEHLGSLERGMDFVVNSVETRLKHRFLTNH